METKRFKPLIDKLFWINLISIAALGLGVTVVPALFDYITLLWTVPVFLFIVYFFASPLFGYVELRESSVFIKYGFILKKEIPYSKIRGAKKERRFYSESMIALKNSLEHVDIKYNAFDITTVSVVDNDTFIRELNERCSKCAS